MIQATRCRHPLVRAVGVAVALALLPAAADAAMLRNATGSTLKVYFYDQNDSAVIVPCYAIDVPAGVQVALSGLPGTCDAYSSAKVKAIVVRSLLVDGATCWGEHLGANGNAVVSGNDNSCTIAITP